GVAAAAASIQKVAIGASVNAIRQADGGTAKMDGRAAAFVTDTLTVSNAPPHTFLLIVGSLLSTASGVAEATVVESVTVNGFSCQLVQSSGQGSCSLQAPMTDDGLFGLTLEVNGVASVGCGPPDCAGAAAKFNAGLNGPGGGRILA